jgi:dynein heavy chain
MGSVFISSSIISYCGPFSITYRNSLMEKWKNNIDELQIPCTENFTLADTLEIPINIRDWILEGVFYFGLSFLEIFFLYRLE